MSVEKNTAPENAESPRITDPDIAIVIEPRTRDLGGFTVGRVLPFAKRRMVGPFIFFDEMGPADFKAGDGIDVRPHPHIGLATVTYLFEGELRHRDNLGFDQIIRPGDVNWMTAGRGIVHSERTDKDRRRTGQRLHGIQCWVALPEKDAETAPSFHHHAKSSLPIISKPGAELILIAGAAYGERSPVETFSPMFYVSCDVEADAEIALPEDHKERALYILSGRINVNGQSFEAGRMVVFNTGSTPSIEARSASKLMLLGGDPIGERHIWWNFVASSKERIEQAKEDWRDGEVGGFKDGVFTLPPGENEFIPTPEN